MKKREVNCWIDHDQATLHIEIPLRPGSEAITVAPYIHDAVYTIIAHTHVNLCFDCIEHQISAAVEAWR